MEIIRKEPDSVYVKVEENGYITDVNSSVFLRDLNGWCKIDEGYGIRFRDAQGNYFPNSVRTQRGAYRYKLADGVPTECTAEEIKAQEEALKPTQPVTDMDRLEAQVTYTAMMTDTLLEV